MEQSVICYAWQEPVTEHAQAEVKDVCAQRQSVTKCYSAMQCYFIDHPRDGVVYNSGRVCMSVSCLSVCLYICMSVRRQLSKALTYEVHICTWGISPRIMGQVCIRRSSGHCQGREFSFPQCKDSIDNNSCSIKHTAVQHGVFGYGGLNGVTDIFVTPSRVVPP